MEIKWYFKNIIKAICVTFIVALFVNSMAILLGDNLTIEYALLWSSIFSIMTTIAELPLYGLVTKEIDSCEKERIIKILLKLNYVEVDSDYYTSSGKCIYFKQSNFLNLFSDIVICDNGNSSIVYMSKVMEKSIE